MLGLGLGLNKGSYIKPLPKYLTDAGCTFAINVDRQVKALANPNSPFINPLVDVVGKLGKNILQPFLENGSYSTTTGQPVVDATRQRTILFSKIKPSTQYICSVGGALAGFLTYFYDANFNFISHFNGNNFISPNNAEYVKVARLAGNTDWQIEPGLTVTTYEPYGFNNVLLQSFAGTTADGYTQIALPNGKNPWFLNSDGTDSYMIGVNNADTGILGTVNFGLGFYTRTNGTLVNSWLISKAESSEATTQYGVKITSAGALQLFLNGASITLATGLAINTPYKIIIVREAGTLKCEVNDVETYSVAEATSLTTRPNLRLGARSSNVGGTTHTEFYNGYFGAVDLSQGSLCTLASFKKSFAKLIGGTYV